MGFLCIYYPHVLKQSRISLLLVKLIVIEIFFVDNWCCLWSKISHSWWGQVHNTWNMGSSLIISSIIFKILLCINWEATRAIVEFMCQLFYWSIAPVNHIDVTDSPSIPDWAHGLDLRASMKIICEKEKPWALCRKAQIGSSLPSVSGDAISVHEVGCLKVPLSCCWAH